MSQKKLIPIKKLKIIRRPPPMKSSKWIPVLKCHRGDENKYLTMKALRDIKQGEEIILNKRMIEAILFKFTYDEIWAYIEDKTKAQLKIGVVK